MRISFYGAPSSGKTTLAAELFSELKKSNVRCEYVNELAREWAYIDRPIQSMDQIFLFATQMHREDSLLSREKCDLVITDSPVVLNAFYSILKDKMLKESLLGLAKLYDQKYSTINFFCPLNSKFKFDSSGRHHSPNELIDLENDILEFVELYCADTKQKLYILQNQNDRLTQVIDVLKKNGINYE